MLRLVLNLGHGRARQYENVEVLVPSLAHGCRRTQVVRDAAEIRFKLPWPFRASICRTAIKNDFV